MTRPTCATCVHFRLSTGPDKEIGECRRNPPVIDFTQPETYPNGPNTEAPTHARFPVVRVKYFCGEWRGPNSAEEALGYLVSIIGDATGQQIDPADALQIARELVRRGVVSL